MTYDKAKTLFWQFRTITNMSELRAFVAFKRRERETQQALIYYAAQMGAILIQGKYEQVFEYNTKTGSLNVAQLKFDRFISMDSIIKKPDCVYVHAWDESWAKRKLKI